jgi:hypothetical protein
MGRLDEHGPNPGVGGPVGKLDGVFGRFMGRSGDDDFVRGCGLDASGDDAFGFVVAEEDGLAG